MSRADNERYERAIHAMQSGVAFEMTRGGGPGSGDTRIRKATGADVHLA
jgi:hypothetical protein